MIKLLSGRWIPSAIWMLASLYVIALISLILLMAQAPAPQREIGELSDAGRLAAPEAGPTATPTSAGPTWRPAGFGGAGNFDGVFFDPHISGTVYAASDVAGVFRSTDNGDHWEMRSVGLGNYEVSSLRALDQLTINPGHEPD